MFRKIVDLFFSLLMFALPVFGYQSDFVTYDWFCEQASTTSYMDHIPHWRRLFNTIKVRGMLECGCGYSSAYFMDNVDNLISIEYITPGYGDHWYQICKSLYSDRPNWIPMTYNADYRSNGFNNACAYQCAMHKDYALIDNIYLIELDRHFKEQIKNANDRGCPIDVAFVDPGVYVRGDMVKLLLANNIPVVAAHDTASDYGTKEKENLYGWNKVITPANYVKIYIPYGQGTTFWIHERLPSVIASMLGYRDAIVQMQDEGGVTWQELTAIADMPQFLPNN